MAEKLQEQLDAEATGHLQLQQAEAALKSGRPLFRLLSSVGVGRPTFL